MRNKAFTLIELLIVIIILTILMWTIWFFLPDKVDKKIKFGKECSNYIFQEILNEKNNIEKNKIINSWWIVYPHTLSNISTNKENLSLKIESIYWNKILDREIINWNWICLSKSISNQNSYIIKSDTISININAKSVFQDNQLILNVCDKNKENCLSMSHIEYNKAIWKFEKKTCLVFSWWNCIEWE